MVVRTRPHLHPINASLLFTLCPLPKALCPKPSARNPLPSAHNPLPTSPDISPRTNASCPGRRDQVVTTDPFGSYTFGSPFGHPCRCQTWPPKVPCSSTVS